MDLVNLKPHMAGQKVQVNGRVYQIDPHGVLKGIPDADAQKLLKGKSWESYDPATVEARKAAAKKKGGITLIDAKGERLGKTATVPEEDFLALKDAYDRLLAEFQSRSAEYVGMGQRLQEAENELLRLKGSDMAQVVPPPEAVIVPPPPLSEPVTPPQASDLLAQVEGGGEETEGDDEEEEEAEEEDEWPDPKESMPKPYLQQMADAYGVTYEESHTKAELVKMISAAMYE